MNPEILVQATLSDKELLFVNKIAADLGVSREEVIRRAVNFFCTSCVPTHHEESATR